MHPHHLYSSLTTDGWLVLEVCSLLMRHFFFAKKRNRKFIISPLWGIIWIPKSHYILNTLSGTTASPSSDSGMCQPSQVSKRIDRLQKSLKILYQGCPAVLGKETFKLSTLSRGIDEQPTGGYWLLFIEMYCLTNDWLKLV